MTPLKLFLNAAAGAAILALAAPAQGATPVNTAFSAVTAGDYKIEPNHTRILFSLSHMGFTTWYGNFSKASGTAHIDPAHVDQDAVDVTVPTASVTTTNTTLDGELKGDGWFDAAKFPDITFKARHFTVSGPNGGQVEGDLTLHGVTRPVTLTVKFNGSGVNRLDGAYTAGFEASGVIKRSDFGVTKYIPLVGDEVSLIISAAFEKGKG